MRDIERTMAYRSLITIARGADDEWIKFRAEHALANHLGNEVYLEDVYNEIKKSAKSVKIEGKNYKKIGNAYRNTKSRFNDWFIMEA